MDSEHHKLNVCYLLTVYFVIIHQSLSRSVHIWLFSPDSINTTSDRSFKLFFTSYPQVESNKLTPVNISLCDVEAFTKAIC